MVIAVSGGTVVLHHVADRRNRLDGSAQRHDMLEHRLVSGIFEVFHRDPGILHFVEVNARWLWILHWIADDPSKNVRLKRLLIEVSVMLVLMPVSPGHQCLLIFIKHRTSGDGARVVHPIGFHAVSFVQFGNMGACSAAGAGGEDAG